MRMRLDPAERRRQIVQAAMPLFARKGFSGTTTKEIAEAAQVSEGLLFKYFASKTALYTAIIEVCSNDDPSRFEALAHLAPSTASLAIIVHDVVAYFATLKQRNAAEQSRHRLFLQSLTDDGEFARIGLAAFSFAMLPLLERSLAAAREAGDLADIVPVSRTFWLAALLQITMGSMALHGGLKTNDQLSAQEWAAETTRFILRGMGVKAEAVHAACAAINWKAWPNIETDEHIAQPQIKAARVA
jgi:TetR/AcrR family transcriptional regulator, transcriptional repressor of aconitase